MIRGAALSKELHIEQYRAFDQKARVAKIKKHQSGTPLCCYTVTAHSRRSCYALLFAGDIGSADLVNHLLRSEGIDTIINYAAQSHVDNSFGNSITFTENNSKSGFVSGFSFGGI